MTSYKHRLKNIPTVLDTIYAQTMQPDLVVLNLAYDEEVPDDVWNYIEEHKIDVNRVEDTKVYKKLIPTLKKYPDDCIITIDDDFLYPKGMIEDFWKVHVQYPDNPISGNRVFYNVFQCHCGCASLTKTVFLGNYIDDIDEDVMSNCPCDDIVYTYFSNKNGHPYMRTREMYFINMQKFQEGEGYSDKVGPASITNSFKYLVQRFGKLENNLDKYITNKDLEDLMKDYVAANMELAFSKGSDYMRSSYSYRLGHFVLTPVRKLRELLSCCE